MLHFLCLYWIHHSAICESGQQKIFFTETSFSTANFTDTIILFNSKQAINSNRGTGSSFTGVNLNLLVDTLTEPPCSQLTRTNTQAPYIFDISTLTTKNMPWSVNKTKLSLNHANIYKFVNNISIVYKFVLFRFIFSKFLKYELLF